jgi:hypothetical protein
MSEDIVTQTTLHRKEDSGGAQPSESRDPLADFEVVTTAKGNTFLRKKSPDIAPTPPK